MKNLITALMLLTLSFSFGQFVNAKSETNNISILQSPGSYDDGFSFGIQVDRQDKIVYYGIELYHFPNLNDDGWDQDLTYTHGIGRFGFNVKRFGNDFGNKLRLYTGVRGGTIYRAERFHALLGGEIGMQYTFKNGFFLSISAVRDFKTDSTLWNEDNHTVDSGIYGIGWRF